MKYPMSLFTTKLLARRLCLSIIVTLFVTVASVRTESNDRLPGDTLGKQNEELRRSRLALIKELDDCRGYLLKLTDDRNKAAELIVKLTGARNYSDIDFETLERLTAERFRTYKIAGETLNEFAWIFRNFNSGGGGLPHNRHWYAYKLYVGQRIRPGMTEKEVEQLLGKPDHIKQDKDRLDWVYLDRDFGELTLSFRSGQLVAAEQHNATTETKAPWWKTENK